MERPLVSIIVPAYNAPDYTRKTLQSLIEQEYRPLEILVSDDCSPVSLEPLVDEFKRFEDPSLLIKYFRQASNLRADNLPFLFDRVLGKYVVYMPHDDWFVDQRFIAEAVERMESQPQCYLCVANSEIENTNGDTMLHFPPALGGSQAWTMLEGDHYIRFLGNDGMGYPAWSAIAFHVEKARSQGAMRYPFFITESMARELNILSDEGFAFQFLLSSIGSVAVTQKVVSVRGMPPTSYSKTTHWSKIGNQALFMIYFNLSQAKLGGRYSRTVKKRARQTLFQYPMNAINPKILRYYHYHPKAVWMMFLSYVLYLAHSTRRSYIRLGPVYENYGRGILRRSIPYLRSGRMAQGFEKLLSKIKKHGLVHVLFPFR